jgi:hypothetical protein
MSNISNRSDCHCPSRIEQRRRVAALCHLDDPLREQLAARSLETIHFGPEYCGRALSRREGGEWGDGNECTGDEAPCRRERSETADGRCGPGRGKGSGSRREDNLQGRDRHNRDGIHDFIALERVLMIRDRSAECLADSLPARILRFEGYVACEGGFAAPRFGRGDDGRRNHVPRETARTRLQRGGGRAHDVRVDRVRWPDHDVRWTRVRPAALAWIGLFHENPPRPHRRKTGFHPACSSNQFSNLRIFAVRGRSRWS